ncbi:MAG: hypothetical protein ACR2OZ_20140 [Verrucomicrobiales bacterium]
MKTTQRYLFGMTAALSANSTLAEPVLKWFTVDGGGGTAAGGSFMVRGSIGLLDAAASSLAGGSYTLRGGFWQDFALPTPGGGPGLTLTRSRGGEVRLSWPAEAAGYQIEVSADLLNWAADGSVPLPGAGEKDFPAPSAAVPRRFWRLNKL